MHRRTFLLAGLAAMTAPGILYARPESAPRVLFLHHTHTGEELELAWSPEHEPSAQAVARLDHFLRDFRTEQTFPMDRDLVQLLSELTRRVGNPEGVIEIISAYRSPKTNNMLRSKSNGVARRSLHMQGRALDIRLRGTATTRLRDQAIAMARGGVGYYRRSDFVHLDTGAVRHW